jgi:anti-sigma factor RsiW
MAEDQQRRGMNCEEARERIHQDLDGDLMAAESRQALDAHLDGCPDCRQADAELRALQQALSAIPAVPLPDEALDEVRQRTTAPDRTRSRWLDWRAAAAAAVLALAIYGSWTAVGPVAEPEPTEQEVAEAAEQARRVLALTGQALRGAKQTAFNDVLADEVSPALQRIPTRLREATRIERRSSGNDA